MILMKKAEGSILIEIIASIIMLSIASIFAVSASFKCLIQYKNRSSEEKINRIVNMIIKEIKYNKSKNDLDKAFYDNDSIYFKYDDSMDDKLFEQDIFSLETGNNIEIKKINEDKMRTNYKIKVSIDDESFYYEGEEKFYKSWWMDEI